MIFRIEITQREGGWQALITSPDVPGWASINRSGELDADGYPLPPAGEVAPNEGAAKLAAASAAPERQAARERFNAQEPEPGEVAAFGGYLFAVLLGGDWAALENAAPAEPIRLQLKIPPGTSWNQLPWELMVGPVGPLAALSRIVSIARVIDVVPRPGMLSIDIPLRVLFVIGRETDNNLRPVAEYLSVVRQFQATISNGNVASGIALHARLLMDATTDDIDTTLREFRPAVVHVIAHGELEGADSVVILTRYESAGRLNPRPRSVTAVQLAAALDATGAARPHAVVLNACNTAQTGDVPASFAAQLVQAGIPVAVGMAGEVADAACRLFTRQFYAALIDQQPADIAAAKGRRAALLHFQNYAQNFHWGRGVFCQADGVDTVFNVNSVQQSLIEAADDLRPKDKRGPFCGRLSWLPRFRDVFTNRTINLAIGSSEEIGEDEVRPQVGKSRLIEEIAWQAVLEGWVPVHIRQKRNPNSNLMHFGVNFVESLQKTRDTFGVARATHSALVQIACERWEVKYASGELTPFQLARNDVLLKLSPTQNITERIGADTIWQCMAADVAALRADVETQLPARKGVLILWDQLDAEEVIGDDCISAMGRWGLGSKACPAPVVFTYSRRSAGGKKLLEAINANNSIEPQLLAPFDSPETLFACQQYFAWAKYVLSPSKRAEFGSMWSKLFTDEWVKGYPSNLYGVEVKTAIRILTEQKFFTQVDDAAIVNEFR